MIMRLIRWPIGQLILVINALTAPRPPQRPAGQQARLDAVTQDLTLYQFHACPFCVKTRRAIRRLGLNIELRDAKREQRWHDELLAEGGRVQVPCLRIPRAGDTLWLYESNDIIAYLEDLVAEQELMDAA